MDPELLRALSDMEVRLIAKVEKLGEHLSDHHIMSVQAVAHLNNRLDRVVGVFERLADAVEKLLSGPPKEVLKDTGQQLLIPLIKWLIIANVLGAVVAALGGEGVRLLAKYVFGVVTP